MNAPREKSPLRLAALISGTGRTLRNILRGIAAARLHAEVRLVISNTPNARGLQHAEKASIPIRVIERKDFGSRQEFSKAIFDACRAAEVDLVVMAGFIKRLVIPRDFENRVLSTHPSLAPAFCGRGFYGDHIHEAVLESGVKLSGCTVHFVDNEYDHGPIILQRVVPVLDDDTLDTLEARVFAAECDTFLEALSLIAAGRVEVQGRRVRVLPE